MLPNIFREISANLPRLVRAGATREARKDGQLKRLCGHNDPD
jgi:hypothetical protein